jgi:hypothetical protein
MENSNLFSKEKIERKETMQTTTRVTDPDLDMAEKGVLIITRGGLAI